MSFQILKNIIEKKSGDESFELINLLTRTPTLLNEVDENGNNILMYVIELGKTELALDILKVMADLNFENRTHCNHKEINVLQLAIQKRMGTVAKQILLLNNTFSLHLLDKSNPVQLLFMLFLNNDEINSKPDYKLAELKLFFAFMTSYITSMRKDMKDDHAYSIFITIFASLFPSIKVNLPILNTGVMPGIVEGIDEPLDFVLLETLATDFYAGQSLSCAITTKEKISLLLCATVYDDKNLIDYIASVTCSDIVPFLNQEAQTKISANPNIPIDILAQQQFSEIRALFTNPSLCLNLLETLENQLKNHFESLGIELPKVNKNSVLSTGIFCWPNPEKWQGPKTMGVLNQLLLQKERHYGINNHPYAPAFFAGNVNYQEGNKFVGELNIFKEFKKSTSPLHGMEVHRLQWHLIMLGAEKGGIFSYITPNDIPGLLQASVRVYGDLIFWPTIFDNYPQNKQQMHAIGSSCPNYLHSLVMLSNLHYLSACFFEKYTKSLAFLAKDAGHNSSARELLICDLRRGFSFEPNLKPSQLPTTYYSNEQLEFYSNHLSASGNQGNNSNCIFYKKTEKQLINSEHVELTSFTN